MGGKLTLECPFFWEKLTIACGTPVITFITGGSPEAVDDSYGTIVEAGNMEQLAYEILNVKKNGKSSYAKFCRARAEKLCSARDRYGDYLELYDRILKKVNKFNVYYIIS